MFINLLPNHRFVDFYLEVRLFLAENYTFCRERRLHLTMLPLLGHGVDLLLVLVKLREDFAFSHLEFGVDHNGPVVLAIQKFRERTPEVLFTLGTNFFESPDGDVVEDERHRRRGLVFRVLFHAIGEALLRGDHKRFSVFLSDGYIFQTTDVDGCWLRELEVSQFRRFREFHFPLFMNEKGLFLKFRFWWKSFVFVAFFRS